MCYSLSKLTYVQTNSDMGASVEFKQICDELLWSNGTKFNTEKNGHSYFLKSTISEILTLVL